MKWTNPLLSVLLCLHYLAIHVVGQFNSNFKNSQRFAKKASSDFNNSSHSSGHASSKTSNNYSKSNYSNFNSNNHYADPACANSNLTRPAHCYTVSNSNNNNQKNNYNYGNYNQNEYVIPVPTAAQNQYYYQYGDYSGGNGNLNYYPEKGNQIQYQPISQYSDPYKLHGKIHSRMEDTSHSSVSSSGSHSTIGTYHLPQSMTHSDSHREHNMHHEGNHHHYQETQKGPDGWGWSKGHNHEPEKQNKHKKKKKKGALAKLLKKFKPKRKPEKLIWKEVAECDGFENFIKDVEIISLKLGWLGFKKATIGFLLHVVNQLYGFYSVVKVGLPERLTSFIDLVAPETTPETLRTVLAILGLLDYIVLFFFSYPIGNLIVAVDFLAEIFTFASLALATFTIFDDIFEEKVSAIFGIDLREVFEGYGCNNPYSKEKKIEQLFETFNEW